MHNAPLECPLPKDLNVKAARDHYLAENGFSEEGYAETWSPISFLGLTFSIPNTKSRRWAIMRHDLHHAATGYGTDLVGEAEISAWEVAKGFRGLDLYVSSIVATVALMGLVIAPRRTVAAFRASGGGPSLFQSGGSYESLLAMDLAQLRETLGVAPDGVAAHPRRLHRKAPR